MGKSKDTRKFSDFAIQHGHSNMVKKLSKDGSAILSTMTPKQAEILHMAVGIAGEAGELLDAIKKHVIYNKPLDLVNVIEELGDLEFYMEGLRQLVNITRELTLDNNINKLLTGEKARYGKGEYSDEQAQDRADKQ